MHLNNGTKRINMFTTKIIRRNFLAGAIASASVGKALANPSAINMDFGKFLLSGFRGTRVDDPEVIEVCDFLRRGEIAGVLLLGRNIVSPEQLIALIEVLRASANERNFIPIIAIDQEGGRVARLGPENGFLEWLSASEIANLDMSNEDILEYFTLRARQLGSVGINVNFAPVVDLNVNPNNPIIGQLDRSYSSNSDEVVRFAALFIQAHNSVSVKTCLKHFPGHGSSALDSHLGLVDVSQTWSPEELLPFAELVRTTDVDAIMTAHILNEQITKKESVPFTLSRFLRPTLVEEVGYAGVLFSDDMQMGAITKKYRRGEAARLALNAGNTFLIYSNYPTGSTIRTAQEIRTGLEIEFALGLIDTVTIKIASEMARKFCDSLV